jgi:hypothetical protein
VAATGALLGYASVRTPGGGLGACKRLKRRRNVGTHPGDAGRWARNACTCASKARRCAGKACRRLRKACNPFGQGVQPSEEGLQARQ